MSDTDAPVTKRATGRRTVSSLTTSQIQHKRDLDRKAQRALRQRTKLRIQELENDLARFKDSVSQREKTMLDDIEQLREQNRQLRFSLQSIGLFAMGAVSHRGHTSSTQEFLHEGVDPSGSDTLGYDVTPLQPGLSFGNLSPVSSKVAPPATIGSAANEPAQNERLRRPSPNLSSSEGAVASPVALERAAGSSPTGTIQDTQSSDPITPKPRNDRGSSIACALPQHTPATCPLDHILLDFIATSQDLVARGAPIDEILGPDQPCPRDLLNPTTMSTTHTVSRVMGEVLATFPHVNLPEKMAFMYLMHRTTKWQICPNSESYNWLPVWLRPTAMQIVTAHAAWIDNIPWPRVRDILIENPDRYPFALFSELYSHNVSVNWSYDPEDIFSESEDGPAINPIFEKHITRLSNWTVSRQFREYFSDWPSDIDIKGF